jgi:hypothetical protein
MTGALPVVPLRRSHPSITNLAVGGERSLQLVTNCFPARPAGSGDRRWTAGRSGGAQQAQLVTQRGIGHHQVDE